ncbi:MAG: ATP-binding cassette domain-containing protein [Methylophaga sp.]|nr:ATP-binding cassette domain-containing protein [Methylophaga sp.]
MSTDIIEARTIHASAGQKLLLSDINLSVPQGQFLALVGPNGAGKSTLLKLLSGLVYADSGEITLSGDNIARMKPAQISALLSYLPQSSAIYWNYLVSDILEIHSATDSLSLTAAHAVFSAYDHAKAFDIEQLIDRQFKTLSGGEQARVLLAACLISSPSILLADEPAAALDVSHQLQLLKIIKDRTSDGLTAIVVMHDLNLASRFADRIIVLNNGKIQMDGTSREVSLSPALDHHFDVYFQRLSHEQQTILVPDFHSARPADELASTSTNALLKAV